MISFKNHIRTNLSVPLGPRTLSYNVTSTRKKLTQTPKLVTEIADDDDPTMGISRSSYLLNGWKNEDYHRIAHPPLSTGL